MAWTAENRRVLAPAEDALVRAPRRYDDTERHARAPVRAAALTCCYAEAAVPIRRGRARSGEGAIMVSWEDLPPRLDVLLDWRKPWSVERFLEAAKLYGLLLWPSDDDKQHEHLVLCVQFHLRNLEGGGAWEEGA